jgi:hypothetical protein
MDLRLANPLTSLLSMVLCFLAVACSTSGSVQADSAATITPCPDAQTDAFAAWQCQRYYARQKINGYCLTVAGGEVGTRQCQQYYTKLAEQPAPTPTLVEPRPQTTYPPAEFAVKTFPHRATIVLSGTIGSGDDVKFARRTGNLHHPIIVLTGPGGNTHAAVEIGKLIRRRGWDTMVPEGQSCMSACALAWLGGIHRYMGWSSAIGFHASYLIAAGRAVESGVANAIVGAYLNGLGLPERAVIYITMSAPDEIQLLTLNDARAVGIQVSVLGP